MKDILNEEQIKTLENIYGDEILNNYYMKPDGNRLRIEIPYMGQTINEEVASKLKKVGLSGLGIEMNVIEKEEVGVVYKEPSNVKNIFFYID